MRTSRTLLIGVAIACTVSLTAAQSPAPAPRPLPHRIRGPISTSATSASRSTR